MAVLGEPDQYTFISVQQPMQFPDEETLGHLTDLERAAGDAGTRSDFVDAIAVAADCLYRESMPSLKALPGWRS